MVLNLSEVDMLRYGMYSLYLCGDAILATKTAIVAFFAEFILVLLKVAYKEPRPFWTHQEIQGWRCQNDFEGPSDHIFLLVFIGTYVNIVYLHKYAKKPKIILSYVMGALTVILVCLTASAGFFLGHTYIMQCVTAIVYGLFYTLGCLSLDT